MYASLSAFIDAWSTESKNTHNVLTCLTDGHLDFGVPGFDRSLGQLGWHIVTALKEIGGRAGLEVDGPDRHALTPTKAGLIVDRYDRAALSISNGAERCHEGFLDGLVDVYGERWTRTRTLQVMVGHEIHHRGQLTVLLRIAGLNVPETYGPTRRTPGTVEQ